MKLMLDKCTDAELMWGCAFAYDVPSHQDGGGSSTIYVRLREDRRSVDVVAVMDEGHGSDNVVRQELDGISRLLGKDYNGANERMHLCPMCCSADMFVRLGAAHAFHMQELDGGGVLQCSRYHVVTVADGYARNFLLPNGNAIAWSQGGEKQIQGIRRARTAREIRDLDHAKQIKSSLEANEITVKVKVGSEGRLFGSVTDKDVAASIKAAVGVDVDRHRIKMDKHIKLVGKYVAKVSLQGSVVANVTVDVVPA
jgi:large subunit ribosomal protein L9